MIWKSTQGRLPQLSCDCFIKDSYGDISPAFYIPQVKKFFIIGPMEDGNVCVAVIDAKQYCTMTEYFDDIVKRLEALEEKQK